MIFLFKFIILILIVAIIFLLLLFNFMILILIPAIMFLLFIVYFVIITLLVLLLLKLSIIFDIDIDIRKIKWFCSTRFIATISVILSLVTTFYFYKKGILQEMKQEIEAQHKESKCK